MLRNDWLSYTVINLSPKHLITNNINTFPLFLITSTTGPNNELTWQNASLQSNVGYNPPSCLLLSLPSLHTFQLKALENPPSYPNTSPRNVKIFPFTTREIFDNGTRLWFPLSALF